MSEAFIVDAIRTPVGKRRGALAEAHPIDLSAHVIGGLMSRTDVDPVEVDDVIWGCVDQIGPQAGDIARLSWLAAGLPEEVPGVTIERQCGSGQQAVHFAAQAVMSGTAALVVAGGVQNMSMIPINSSAVLGQQFGHPTPWQSSRAFQDRYGDVEITQFRGAEMIAEQWNLSREDMELFALESHRRAISAIDDGRFEREILPYVGVTTDEGPRRNTSLEALSALDPVPGCTVITAGVSSQISDASAAMLIASEDAVKRFGLTPRARLHHLSVRAEDPVRMLSAPIPATRRALAAARLSIDDIDIYEVNEAFASVPLAWARELDADPERLNVNGGAIALGHPIGASGTRLMVTLLHELERRGGRYGLQTMCEGGGQANVTIIERL